MATKKPKGLGRGLEALLGPTAAPSADNSGNGGNSGSEEGGAQRNPTTLMLDQMVAGVYQPRTRMDEGALYELAESIKAQGIMQPILVRRLDAESAEAKNAEYEIIAGERRFRAARLAGLDSVPVLVRDVPNEAAAAMSLIENIQREDLNSLEEARALDRLINEFQLTHQQCADAIGRSRAAVSNLLRLLEASPEVCEMVAQHALEMGHARALLGITNKRKQAEVAATVVKRGMSVRDTEALVRRLGGATKGGAAGGSAVTGGDTGDAASAAAASQADPNVSRLEQELAEKLGAKVVIEHAASGKGKVVVSYNSLDELDGILAHIQ